MPHPKMQLHLEDEQATQEIAVLLGKILSAPALITLSGELGSGKTTLVKHTLQSLGIATPIKSPSYALVEHYQQNGVDLYHFDFYRLHSADELEAIGFRDYLTANAISFIEWPEHAGGLLPPIDIHCHLDYVQKGRTLQLIAHSLRGEEWLNRLQQLIYAHEKK